ncbi:MAG TPA: DUF1877 family protein [Pirellulaceae bacterium]|nr:DUF1877 family protein [Pirellulaceae bacterium]
MGREHAKTLFGIKEDGPLLKFLDELKVRPDMKKSGRVLETGVLWDPLHRCLTEGELDPAGGDFPLNHAVLGGKQLHKGADHAAILVRPDMVRFISDALAEISEETMRQKFFGLPKAACCVAQDEKHFMELWLALQNLQVFFQAAADNLEAVVFTAKWRE